jgi:SAM-dependent methyltransferase
MEYKTRAPGCSYKDGTLLGHRVNFLVGRGEDFLFSEVYDLVIMINGIEHCQDGISVLHNLYHAIKPGGYLIWHERSFDEYEGLPYSYSTDFIDFLLHPLRLKTSFFEWFLLDHFESIYYNVTAIPELSSLKNLTSKDIYFIGRKPMIDLGARYLQQRLPSSRRSPDL